MLACFGALPQLFSQNLQEHLKQSDWLKRTGNREASLSLLNEVIAQSELEQDFALKAQALYDKAAWHNYFMQYDSAIIYGQRALAFVEEQNLSDLRPKFLLQNGWLVLKRYDFEKALEYCRKAKELAEKQEKTSIQIVCNACIEDALGIFYLGSLDEEYYYPVLHAYEKVVQLYKEEKDTNNYASYLTRYIDLYRIKGDADSTKMFLQELESVYKHYTNYRLESSLFSIRAILADMYDDSDSVYINLRKAQQKSKRIGLPRLVQHYYFRLHEHFKDLRLYDKSIEMLDSAVATYHVDHMHANGYDLYYYVYKDAGNTTKALEYLEKWHHSEDWERKNEKMDLITEWETKYKTQEKETLLEKERIQRYWLSAFLLLVFVSSLFIIRAYRKQKKIALQLSQQKQVIESQAKELQQLDKVKSRFFANVAHELRTPLTLILGPVSSILKRGGMDNQNLSLLKLVQLNGAQLLKLINSILDLSRLESGRLELKEEAIILYPLVKRIISQFESNAQIQKIELVLIYQLDAYLKIQLDISKFETILNNLLSNALKFTPQGGRIELICNDLDNKISISVCDTGSGIHPNDLPFVFNRFYQTRQVNAPVEGGSGIGLALSMELAKLFKGNLSVESELQKGSTFYFTFPKKEVLGFVKEVFTEKAEAILLSSDSHKNGEVVLSKELLTSTSDAHLLLVEDNPSLRQYLQTVLGSHYQITMAENGKVALEYLEASSRYQLIISDVMMPVMDGYQLLERLKSDDRWRHLPVVMLTARAELKDKLKALRIGVDDYLLKPFDEEELLVRIANLLNNSKQRREVVELEDASQIPPAPSISKAEMDWLEQVEQIIQAEIQNTQLTQTQLAESLFLSERQFRRKIKKITGLTPNKYIREIKLQHARALLEDHTYLTVSEVGYAIGFGKPEYFSKLYKERFGKLPSEYLV